MGPPPTPREPQKWSKEFHDFISACLQHDAKARPDAKDLLKVSPFLLAPHSLSLAVSPP